MDIEVWYNLKAKFMENSLQANRYLKYFDWIVGLFVAVLIISEIGSSKIAAFGPFNFDGGTVLFPISYIFGDVLTEVYGYARARRVIWIGFVSVLLLALTLMIIQYLPAAPDWHNQQAYQSILGFVPRIVLASIMAFWAGEFSNSYVLAKMKVWTLGKWLWTRTIGSTIVGEGIDSLVFTLVAFAGTIPTFAVFNIIFTIYIFKVLFEVAATPLTYAVVNYLKRSEGLDAFDAKTDFNPFKASEATE